MANDNQIGVRGGLLPVQYPYGNFRRSLYKLTTSAAAEIFIGQPMTLDANGQAAICATVSNSALLGPVLGFVDTNKAGLPTNLTDFAQNGYLDANIDTFVVIADDPGQLFQIQEDSGGTALTQAGVGARANIIYDTASGSTTTGRSTAQLDASTIAANTGGHLQVVGLIDFMNADGTANDFGDYSKLMVRIANHSLSQDRETVI